MKIPEQLEQVVTYAIPVAKHILRTRNWQGELTLRFLDFVVTLLESWRTLLCDVKEDPTWHKLSEQQQHEHSMGLWTGNNHKYKLEHAQTIASYMCRLGKC